MIYTKLSFIKFQLIFSRFWMYFILILFKLLIRQYTFLSMANFQAIQNNKQFGIAQFFVFNSWLFQFWFFCIFPKILLNFFSLSLYPCRRKSKNVHKSPRSFRPWQTTPTRYRPQRIRMRNLPSPRPEWVSPYWSSI